VLDSDGQEVLLNVDVGGKPSNIVLKVSDTLSCLVCRLPDRDEGRGDRVEGLRSAESNIKSPIPHFSEITCVIYEGSNLPGRVSRCVPRIIQPVRDIVLEIIEGRCRRTSSRSKLTSLNNSPRNGLSEVPNIARK